MSSNRATKRPANCIVMAVVALSAFAAAQPVQAEQAGDHAAAVHKARAAIAGLGQSLQRSLGAALAEGGPVAAIEACQSIAPEATADISSAHSLAVRRTALKVRNPANTADAFERAALETFVMQIESGQDPAALEHSAVIEAGGARTLRYMKPIMMAETPCAACHGTSIAPDVKAKIDELYPQDQAVDFQPGTLRGAFSVTMPLGK